nr:MAG TPA: hypothetical protein [Caudoviricetes sp.]
MQNKALFRAVQKNLVLSGMIYHLSGNITLYGSYMALK